MQGWIKLHRELIEWEWYNDINTRITFIHLLLVSNHKDNNWRGQLIKRGQRWTSISSLAKEVCLSEKQIRNALKKLKKTGEIDIKGASKGTMITICKYDHYQQDEKPKGEQSGEQGANEGRARGEQRATNKNDKNENNVNKEKKSIEIFEFYNSTIHNMPKAKELSAARKKAINARIKEHSLELCKDAIVIAANSDFLNGKSEKGWKANIDWIFNPNNFVKIIEGNYNNTQNNGQPQQTRSDEAKESLFRELEEL